MHIKKKLSKSIFLLLVINLLLAMSCKIVSPEDEYNGELRFTSPSPGKIYSVGDTVHIKWECDTIHGNYIMLEASLKNCDFSTNGIDPLGGNSIIRNEEHWEYLKWVVPESLTCSHDYWSDYYYENTSGQTITLHVVEFDHYHEHGYHDSVEISIK